MPFSSSQKSVAAFLEHKVASFTVDSLGRRWDAAKHPRDSRGRFIETGGIARVGMGGLGTVVRSMLGGKVEVEMADGSRRVVPHQQLTMVRRPDGTKPTASVRKVVTEDARREEDPNRGDGKYDEDKGDDNPFDGVDDDVLANADAPDLDYDEDNPDDSDEDDENDKQAPEAYSPSREKAKRGDLVALTRKDKDGRPEHVLGKIDSLDTDGKPEKVTLAGSKGRKISLADKPVDDYTVIPFEDVEDANALLGDAVDDDGEPDFMDNELATDLVEQHSKQNKARPPAAARPKGAEGGGKAERPVVTSDELRHANTQKGEKPGTIYWRGRPVGTIEKIPHRDPKKAEQGENMYVVTDAYGRKKSKNVPISRPTSDSDTALEQLAKLLNDPEPKKQAAPAPVAAPQAEVAPEVVPDAPEAPEAPRAPSAPVPAPEVVDAEVEKIAAKQRGATTRAATSTGTPATLSRTGNLASIKEGDAHGVYRKTDSPNTGTEDRITIGAHDYTKVGTARNPKEFREEWARSAERDVPATAEAPSAPKAPVAPEVLDKTPTRDLSDEDLETVAMTDGLTTPARQIDALDELADRKRKETAAAVEPAAREQISAPIPDAAPAEPKKPSLRDSLGADGDFDTVGPFKSESQNAIYTSLKTPNQQKAVRNLTAEQQETYFAARVKGRPHTAAVADAKKPAVRPSDAPETTYPENTTPEGAPDESVRTPGAEVLGDVPADRAAEDPAGEPEGVLRGDLDGGGADDRVADPVEPAVEQPAGRQSEAGGASRGDGASQSRGGSTGGAGVPAEGEGDRGQDDAVLGGSGAGDSDRGVAPQAGRDFEPAGQQDLAPKGVDEKLAANMDALRLLRRLEKDGATSATPDEQATLAKFAGWGSLPRVFNLGDDKYAAERDELKALLGDEEYESALDNALNAHYTDAKFIKPMWDLMESLGFNGGDVLEAGAGTGNFIGFAPDGARMRGVEKNDVTAGIAKYLYPSAEIRNESFGDTDVAPNEFDAMIGNVPFGNFPVFDSIDNPGNFFNIHDHFMLKGARGLKPGGVMAVVTSAGTMDKKNGVARKKLDEMGMELVGAVRLPNGAHQDAAGTTVLTDVLVLRKRKDGEPVGDKSWLTSEDMQLDDGNTLPMNSYYAKHPENVLGESRADTSRFSGNDVVGVKGDLANIDGAMSEALARIADDAKAAGKTYSPEGEKGKAPTRKRTSRAATTKAKAKAPAAAVKPAGSTDVYTAPSERTRAREQAKIVGQITHTSTKKSGKGLAHEFTMVDFDGTEKSYVPPKTQADELVAILRMRDIAADLREAESQSMDDTEEMAELRAELNRVYDDYVSKFGPIGRMKRSRTKVNVKDPSDESETDGLTLDDDGTWYRTTFIKPPMGGIRKDATWWSVTGLETDYDEDTDTAKKAAIFKQRTVGFRSLPTSADNPRDAVALSREYDDKIDMDRIAGLLGVSREEAVEQTKGLVYEDHETGDLVDARVYLSGNVRKKAAALEELAALDPEKWGDQARAMRAVVPADKKATAISARLGMAWLPETDMQDFLRFITGNNSARLGKTEEKGWETSPVTKPQNRHPNREGGSGMIRPPGFSGPLVAQYGTERRTSYQLVESLLKGQRPVVKDKNEDGREFINIAETEAAQGMANKIADEFDAWWKRDGERRDRLAKTYNELYRSHTDVNYVDSPYAEYVGMSDAIELDAHQNDSVAMSKDLPAVLLAHEVGTGKTFTMAAAVMEKKRLGQVEKPVIVVPNHLLEQFVREFKVLYPNANLLAGDSNSVKDVNDRRRFAAQAGSHDWDAVVMTKNAFRYLPLSEATTVANDEAKVDELREKRDALLMEKGETKQVKTMGEQIARLEAKLEELRSRIGGDVGAIDFENVGFDYVVVDEAHEYKNDAIESSERALQNVSPNLFAVDLREKLNWLRETQEARGRKSIALFATGTPVSNSTREFFVMMRFLRPDLLEEGNIAEFDDFRAAYLQTEESVEQDVAGRTKVKIREGDALVNAGELKRLWVQFADEVTADDIGLERPKLKNGQGTKTVVPASEPLRQYMAHLAYRLTQIKPSFKPEKGDDTHVAVGTDGLTGAVDLRLLPRAKVEAAGIDYDALTIYDGKLATIGDDVLAEWNRTKDMEFKVKRGLDEDSSVKGAAQIVFLDKGVPGGSAPISAYDEIKNYLIAGGMKADEIAFIHDAAGDPLKMGKLSEKVRNGELKVLIGSTPKMGTGLNVQNRLSMLHHADGAYRPDQIEQRNGRVVRRGNQFDEVEVAYYPVEGSNEGFQWAHVARKDNFLRQFAEADLDATIIGSMDSDIPSEADTIAALGSEDPLVMEETQLKLGLRKQKAAFTSWQSAQEYHSNNVTQNTAKAERLAEARDKVAAAAELVTSTAGDDFAISISANGYSDPVPTDDRPKAVDALQAWADQSLNLQYAQRGEGRPVKMGQLGGMTVYGWSHLDWTGRTTVRFGVAEVNSNLPYYATPTMLDLPLVEVGAKFNVGTIARLENMVAGVKDRPAYLQGIIDKALAEAEESRGEVGGSFAEKAELDALETRHEALRALMRSQNPEDKPALQRFYESATEQWTALRDERLAAGETVKPKEMGEARTSRRKVKGERKAAERQQTGEAAPGPRKRADNATEDTDGSTRTVVGNARERAPQGPRGPRPDGGQPRESQPRPSGPSSDAPSKPVKAESEDPVVLADEIAETAAQADLLEAGDAPVEEQAARDLVDPESTDPEADAAAMVEVHAKDTAPTTDDLPEDVTLTPADDEPTEPEGLIDAPDTDAEDDLRARIEEVREALDKANFDADQGDDDAIDAAVDLRETANELESELAALTAGDEPTMTITPEGDVVDAGDVAETDGDTALPPHKITNHFGTTTMWLDEEYAATDHNGDPIIVDHYWLNGRSWPTAAGWKVKKDGTKYATRASNLHFYVPDDAVAAMQAFYDAENEGQSGDNLRPTPAADVPDADAETMSMTAEDLADEDGADLDAIAQAAREAAEQAVTDEGGSKRKAKKAGEAAARAVEADEATADADRTGETTYTPAPSTPEQERAEADADYEPITPEQLAEEKYPLNPQQQRIADAVVGERKGTTLVRAKAGTGKTSTLEAIARRFQLIAPKERVLYIAFNKTVQTEAEGRMPGNVESRTGHSLAHSWLSRSFVDKKLGRGKGSYPTNTVLRNDQKVADYLGLKSDMATMDAGTSLTPRRVAALALKAVDRFAYSADDKVGEIHFTDLEGKDTIARLSPINRRLIAGLAERIWKDLQDEDGQIKVTHDHYRKMWALSKPDLTKTTGGNKTAATVLFLDEAQDTPPVLAKVVADQKMQKVIVGDTDQQIYSFTGAIDYLGQVEADADLPLDTSYRFGSTIADVANRFLQVLGSDERVIGGGPTAGERVELMEDADAILTRSNAGLLAEALREQENGRRVAVTKGVKADLLNFVETARYLQGKGGAPNRMHEDLAQFENWDQVDQAIAEDGDPKLVMLDNLIKKFGLDGLETIIDQVTELTDAPAGGAGSDTVGASGLLAAVKAKVEGDKLTLTGNTFPLNKALTDDTGKNLRQFGFEYDGTSKTWSVTGSQEVRDDALRGLREQFGTTAPGESADKDYDVVVSTAHKSKGLEWPRVRIADDFRGPKENEKTGEIEMPSPEEMKLAYVAVTRAEKALDTGSLGWVYGYSDENGQAGSPAAAPAPAAAPEAPQADVTPEAPADLVEPDEAPITLTPEDLVADDVTVPEAPAAAEPADFISDDEDEDDDSEWGDDEPQVQDTSWQSIVPKPNEGATSRRSGSYMVYTSDDVTTLPLAEKRPTELDAPEGDGPAPAKDNPDWEVPQGYEEVRFGDLRAGDIYVEWGHVGSEATRSGPQFVINTGADDKGRFSVFSRATHKYERASEFGMPEYLHPDAPVVRQTNQEVLDSEWAAFTKARKRRGDLQERGSAPRDLATPGTSIDGYDAAMRYRDLKVGDRVATYVHPTTGGGLKKPTIQEGRIESFEARIDTDYPKADSRDVRAKIVDENGKVIGNMMVSPDTWIAVNDDDARYNLRPAFADKKAAALEGRSWNPDGQAPAAANEREQSEDDDQDRDGSNEPNTGAGAGAGGGAEGGSGAVPPPVVPLDTDTPDAPDSPDAPDADGVDDNATEAAKRQRDNSRRRYDPQPSANPDASGGGTGAPTPVAGVGLGELPLDGNPDPAGSGAGAAAGGADEDLRTADGRRLGDLTTEELGAELQANMLATQAAINADDAAEIDRLTPLGDAIYRVAERRREDSILAQTEAAARERHPDFGKRIGEVFTNQTANGGMDLLERVGGRDGTPIERLLFRVEKRDGAWGVYGPNDQSPALFAGETRGQAFGWAEDRANGIPEPVEAEGEGLAWNGGNPSNLPPVGSIPVSPALSGELAFFLENNEGANDQGYTLSPNGKVMLVHDKARALSALDAIEDIQGDKARDRTPGAAAIAKAAGARKKMVQALPDPAPQATAAPEADVLNRAFGKTDPTTLNVGDRVSGTLASSGEPGELTVESVNSDGARIRITGTRPDGTRDHISIPSGYDVEQIGSRADADELAWERALPDAPRPEVVDGEPVMDESANLAPGDVIDHNVKGRRGKWRIVSRETGNGLFDKFKVVPAGQTGDDNPQIVNIKKDRPVRVTGRAPEAPEVAADREAEQAEFDALSPEAQAEVNALFGDTPDPTSELLDMASEADETDYRPELLNDGTIENPLGLEAPAESDENYSPEQVRFLADTMQEVLAQADDGEWLPGMFERVKDGVATFRWSGTNDTEHGRRYEWPVESITGIRGVSRIKTLAEEVDPSVLRPGTEVAVMGKSDKGTYRGMLEGVSDDGRALVRDQLGVLRRGPVRGTVRPVLSGFTAGNEPTADDRILAPVPGVWTANGDGLVAAMPREWVAGIQPSADGTFEWRLAGFDGERRTAFDVPLGGGNAPTLDAAKERIEDQFYMLATTGRGFTAVPGNDESDRDNRSREFTDTVEQYRAASGETEGGARDSAAPDAEAPDDIDGATAEWVATGAIAPGDVVRVDGDNGNGSATTRTGHALGTPEEVTVGGGAGKPDKGLRVTVGDDTDGLGDRDTVLTPEASVTARVPRSSGEASGDAPQSHYESQVLSDNVGDTMPLDSQGLGIFPGSTVVDGDRRGEVLGVWDRDVEVRWTAGEDSERVTPGTLTVQPDLQARPNGWTREGKLLADGHMVALESGDVGVVQSVSGDEAQVQVENDTRTMSVGELKVIGKVAAPADGDTAAPAYDVPPSIEGPDVRPSAPMMPTDLPEGVEASKVILKPEDRAALEALGLDTDSITPMEVQEAAARVRWDLPITGDMASDLAAYIAAIATSESRPAGSKRSLTRLVNRLKAASERAGGIEVRQSPQAAQTVKVSDLTRGDAVALPNAATGEVETGTLAGFWLTQNGQVYDALLELPDGTWSRHKLLPDGEAFLLPDLNADLGTPDSDGDDRVQFVEPHVGGRAVESAEVMVEAAVGDEAPESIEQLAADAAERIDSAEADRAQRNSGRRNQAAMERSGLTPQEVEAARRAAEKAADVAAEQVAETVLDTLEDAEPLPGESDAEAAERVRDLVRDADADLDVDTLVADALGGGSDKEQAKARRDVNDALRADLFAMADELAGLGDVQSANELSAIAARLAGKPDERQVQAAAQAVAAGRPGVAARMAARIRGMFSRARAAFGRRVAAIFGGMDKTKRSLRAAVMAARAEWKGTPEVSSVLTDAVKVAEKVAPEGEPMTFGDRVAFWRDQLPADSSMFGKTDAPSRGFRGLTLARLRGGDAVTAEDLTGARLDRAADGGPGKTALAHYEAVRGLGAAMDDEVHARVRGLAPELGDDPAGTVRDAMRAMDDFMAEVRAGEHDALSDDELDALEQQVKADARAKQAAYSNAKAKATREALAQVRPMGANGAIGLNVQGRSDDAPEVEALHWAEQFVPTDWLAKAGTVEAQAGRMGSYNDGTITVAPLGEGMVEGSGKYGASALRGLAHHLEASVPGLAAASWAHQWAQTSTGEAGSRKRRGKNALAWLRDVFPAAGFTDQDGAARWAWDAMEADGVDHYQWLGSGLEDLFSDANKDDDLRQWMLGLLAYMARKG